MSGAVCTSLHNRALHVDHKAIVHVILRQALIGLVDVVGTDDLDVGHNVVLAAEVLRVTFKASGVSGIHARAGRQH